MLADGFVPYGDKLGPARREIRPLAILATQTYAGRPCRTAIARCEVMHAALFGFARPDQRIQTFCGTLARERERAAGMRTRVDLPVECAHRAHTCPFGAVIARDGKSHALERPRTFLFI